MRQNNDKDAQAEGQQVEDQTKEEAVTPSRIQAESNKEEANSIEIDGQHGMQKQKGEDDNLSIARKWIVQKQTKGQRKLTP